VIEKNVEFTRHPRAHFINNRTMEVCMLTNALQRCYLIFMCVVLGGGFTGGWHFQIFRKLDGLAGDIERCYSTRKKLNRDQMCSPSSEVHANNYLNAVPYWL